jgi:hypothetical protein
MMMASPRMRTTLAIDDDVLQAAKALAQQQQRPLGEIISELARRSLQRPLSQASRNGIPLLALKPGTRRVTLDMVNRLRDEAP